MSTHKKGCTAYMMDIETTAYCSCGYCCNWEWGFVTGPIYWAIRPAFPPLVPKKRHEDDVPLERGKRRRNQPLLDRFWSATDARGYPYKGLTATETVPRQRRPGPFHPETYGEGAKLILRMIQPWHWPGQQGTVAADTSFYPFGTQMHVPGYGWAKVEDTGGDIKGPRRIDLYFDNHKEALKWGRRTVRVKVVEPGCSSIDRLPIPGWAKNVVWTLDNVRHGLLG